MLASLQRFHDPCDLTRVQLEEWKEGMVVAAVHCYLMLSSEYSSGCGELSKNQTVLKWRPIYLAKKVKLKRIEGK